MQFGGCAYICVKRTIIITSAVCVLALQATGFAEVIIWSYQGMENWIIKALFRRNG